MFWIPLDELGSSMSLHRHRDWTIPTNTPQVAQAIFPHGSPSLTFCNAIGSISAIMIELLPMEFTRLMNRVYDALQTTISLLVGEA